MDETLKIRRSLSARTSLQGLFSPLRAKAQWISMPPRRRFLPGFLLGIGLVTAGVLTYLHFLEPLTHFWEFVRDQAAVNAYFQGYGLWGPLLLAFYQLLQVIIAIIPGHAFMVAGGYVFGFPQGFVVNYLSVVLASQLAFGLARLAGQPVVNRLVPADSLGRWAEVTRKHGTLFLTVSFILPGFPDDVMNFIAGLSPISGRQFLLANMLGRLPSAILLTLIGSHGLQLPLAIWVGLIMAIVPLLIGYRYLYRHHLAPQWGLESQA